MLGYWRRAEETEKAFQGPWLRTQDLAVRDEEGFITLVGRSGDMYISGGENVYPEEIERVYPSHPDVEEIAVIGVPDPDLGEVGLAFVVLREGADAGRGGIEGTRTRQALPLQDPPTVRAGDFPAPHGHGQGPEVPPAAKTLRSNRMICRCSTTDTESSELLLGAGRCQPIPARPRARRSSAVKDSR